MAIRLNILSASLLSMLLLFGGCATTPKGDDQRDPKVVLAEARKAYVNGEYEKVFDMLLPLAAAGNSDAQYTLGYLYYNGLGVEKSETQAMSWIQRAAAQGNQKALRALK